MGLGGTGWEAMIRATELLFNMALLDLMPTAVYVIDEHGRIRSFNQKACALWGRTPKLMDRDERFCGSWRLFLPCGTLMPHDKTPMMSAITTGASCRNKEVIIEHEDGTRVTVMVNISPVMDEAGKIVGAINAFQDVSELALTRRKLEAHQQELEQAVAARDAFLSICSHELKTPLTSLKMQSDIAKRRLAKQDDSVFDRDRVRKMVEQTDRQLTRLNRLVDDMLDLVRIQTNKLSVTPVPTDLGVLVQEVVDRFCEESPELRQRVRLSRGERVVTAVDPDRLEQVVLNLFVNATKYGGDEPIDVEVETRSSRARIAVRDRGIGIAPADQQRIFERFERVSSVHNVSGLGLGLFVSRQIVDMHGGRIEVESAPGQGSTFTVDLPMVAAPVDAPTHAHVA